MEVIRLKRGEQPPEDADWIELQPTPSGRCNVQGCIGIRRDVVMNYQDFDTIESAEANMIEWARQYGPGRLYIVSGHLKASTTTF